MANNINDTLEELITALGNIKTGASQCCEKGGATVDPPSSGGGVSIGTGGDYPDFATYQNSKCNTANWIYDGVLSLVIWLESNKVNLLAGELGGITVALFAAQALVGPPGWMALIAESLLASIATLVTSYLLDFGNIQAALEDVHDECVQGLYNGGSASAAKANLLSALDGSAYTLTSLERSFVGLLLSSNHLNKLFTANEDSDNYQSGDPVDCSDIQVWTFAASAESFTFADRSNNNGVAAMAWNAGTQALRFSLDVPGGQYYTFATGVGISPTVSIPVGVGNSVQMDFSGPLENSYETWKIIRAIYSDATSDEQLTLATGPSTVAVNVSATKTLVKVEADIRLYSGSTAEELHETIDVYEIRVL